MTSPGNTDAILALERGALGAAILEPSGQQARILAEYTKESDWVSSLHRAVFQAIQRLLARDVLPLEYVAVIGELQSAAVLQSYSNGWELVSSLGEGCVIARPMTKRIAELRRLWRQREEAVAK